MTWTPLRNRISQLPLILAGPVLRRTDSTAVTVWLAMRQAAQVSLKVYSTQYGNGLEIEAIDRPILTGRAQTIAVGQQLHLVAVTAATGSIALQSGQIYAYDLTVQLDQGQPYSLKQALNAEHSPRVSISYFEHGLPTFLLPPQDINQLQILHGSCRKTHGGGIDALPIVDDLLEQSARFVDQRPHQLFFTGDQIYGDDVADPWLFLLTDASDTLLGWEEELPIHWQPNPSVPPLKAKHLPPGERTQVAEQLAGFTAGLPNKPDRTNSHLLGFGEFCTAYLFTWSPVLWADQFPTGKELYGDRKQARIWDREVKTVRDFFQSLHKVRRAVANIPTYMIFDDHDISDDWYLNQDWCIRVLGKPLGRRVVQNGLLAYALCQAWGNTPDRFEAGTSGRQLLTAAEAWSAAGGNDRQAETSIGRLVGLPDANPQTQEPQFRRDENVWILDRHPASLQWDYSIQSDCHEVIVLDTRTWRGYPIADENIAPPMLLSPTAFDRQIRERLQLTQAQNLQTIVIAPTNLIHLRIIDWAQEWSLKQGQVFSNDVGDAWNLHKEALSELLAALFESRDRIIVLSGDIHYGFVARLNYWARRFPKPDRTKTSTELVTEAIKVEEANRVEAKVLIQLTSSAFKNAEVKTQLVQTKLKSILPEPPQEWAGWYGSPDLWEVQTRLDTVRWVKLPPAPAPLIRQLYPAQGNSDIAWTIAAYDPKSLPDWRYRIEWIRRQPAQNVPWGQRLPWLQAGLNRPQTLWQRLCNGIGWLWNNRWVQEGNEVVGESNIGLVQFDGFGDRSQPAPTQTPTVIQKLYWSPPWQLNSLVTSQFDAPFQPEESALPFPLLHSHLAKPAAPKRKTST